MYWSNFPVSQRVKSLLLGRLFPWALETGLPEAIRRRCGGNESAGEAADVDDLIQRVTGLGVGVLGHSL
jgi:hypothetical protein